ncbi:MAG: choice-of-anchor B family protein [Bacteroidetes bacterium]|nr:choice-of-anchor B family protein [Bacteroidota bacterium]
MKKYILSATFLFISSLLFAQANKNMVQRSQLRFPGKQLSNICGYVDSLGNEYALVGHSTGMTIVDVTNPDSIFSVATITGPNSIWREIKTWQHYAYVTTEGGGGLQIIDMRNLPGTILPHQNWTPNISGQVLGSIHALHIDNGFVYLYGSNIGAKGIVIGDLTDPYNPTFAGLYDGSYVHDGYVRNDTAWACQIYAGTFSAIDVSNKANPVVLASQQTPNAFTHNSWLSDNSKYLFTTDEVDNSYLAAYDVSDISNIIFMDKIQSQYPGGQAIVHNTHILNDYAITSWYKDGVVITDCHRPQNLVNVGYIDDCPESGGSYAGVWGVYPFLPSGTIVTSDIDSGLYVYSPTYVRACYFEGIVRDSLCNSLLNNVHVTLIGTNVLDSSDFTGNFKTGTPDAGSYTAEFSKAGYITQTIPVTLVNGVITNVSVKLLSNSTVNLNGFVNDANFAVTLPGANVTFTNTSGTYSLLTDNTGEYNNCATVAGIYDVTVGKWGFETICFDTLVSLASSNFNLSLYPKIQDDFSFNYGWTVQTSATTGAWVRGIPVGTTLNNLNDANPGNDDSNDCTDKAYVTGNAGGAAGADDVDDGATNLFSPVFDISAYVQPIIKYSRWFFNAGGSGIPNDSLHIFISNGTTEVELESVTIQTAGASSWVNQSIDLTGLIPFTNTMQVRVRTADILPGHIVEAGFDNFSVVEGSLGIAQPSPTANLSISPNPSAGEFTFYYADFTASVENQQLIISDISGRVLEKVVLQNAKTKFGKNLPAGAYFASITTTKGEKITQKIVKY